MEIIFTGPQYLQGMWAYICPDLLKAIETEPESEVLLELLYALAKCIETLGAGCLDTQPMAELLRILDKLLNEHFERAVQRLEKRQDEDYDDVRISIFIFYIILEVISWGPFLIYNFTNILLFKF